MVKIKIERWKSYDFIANCKDAFGGIKTIVWRGATNGKPTVVEVDKDIFDYLAYQTSTFESGELRIADSQENKTEIVNELVDPEQYESNSKTRDEIVALFKKGNLKKIEAELKKITDRSTMLFVYSIFEEIKIDLIGSKIELVEKWIGNTQEE
jgi:hypothetical protein